MGIGSGISYADLYMLTILSFCLAIPERVKLKKRIRLLPDAFFFNPKPNLKLTRRKNLF